MRLGRNLSDEALEVLLRLGLALSRPRDEIDLYQSGRQRAIDQAQTRTQERTAEFQRRLADDNGTLIGALQRVVADIVLKRFRSGKLAIHLNND